MAEPRPEDPSRARRERWLVAAIVVFLILFRSAVFVFWPQSHFDADQAVMGLMAKHISELRAFPAFLYGQTYILAVEAWLAAPLFAMAGPSVMALRLPLLAANLAVGLLLLRVFEREVGLRPALALVPTLFFALPAPGTTSHFLAVNGGNVEPSLYVLLLWLTRRRPAWCGAIFAIGFLHREFTLYGLIALVAVEAFRGSLFTRDAGRRYLKMLRVAAEVWLVVQWLKYYSSGAGPGTSLANVYRPQDNVLELAGRTCWDLATLPVGAWKLATIHWPAIFGTQVQPVLDFGIDSSVSQGFPGSWVLLLAVMALALGGVAVRLVTDRRWDPRFDVCAYLVLVALLSNAGYVVARCGEITLVLMRYELLSLVGAAGLGAWFLATQPRRPLVRAWVLLVCVWTGIAGLAHGRLLAEYLTRPPAGAKQLIIRHLDAQGARYALADYWLAYSITFLTNERIIAASTDFIRIQEYQRIVDQHRAEAVLISRRPCAGGREVIPGVYFCPK